MRVLIFTGLTHWGRGGAQRETEHLLAALVARGVETGFVVDRPVDLPGVTHYPTGSHRNPVPALNAAIRAFAPDVVHMIGGGAQTIVATDIACRMTARPWVMTVHNVPPRERRGRFLLGDNRRHYAVRNVLSLPSITTWHLLLRATGYKKVIVHSSYVRDLVLGHGCPAHKIALIPLGAGPAPSRPTADAAVSPFPDGASPRVVTVGAFSHTKGVHDYLRAMPELVKRYPSIHLVWVGAYRYGAYEQFVDAEIASLGLSGHVTLAKNASEEVRLAALADADLYVQPSHEEGFCLTYIEGAQAVPKLLGTKTGAMAEISEGDPWASAVAPGDPEALLRETCRLLDMHDDDPTRHQAERASRLAERFSWDRYAEQHIALFRALART